MSLEYKTYNVEYNDATAPASIDLKNDINVKAELAVTLIKDLISLKDLNSQSLKSTTLTITVQNNDSEKAIKINKDIINKSINFTQNDQEIDTDVYAYLSDLLGLRLDNKILVSRVIDFRNFKPNTPDELKIYINNLNNYIAIDPTLLTDKKAQEESTLKLKEELKSALTEEEKSKLERLDEVKKKLNILQGEVDFYQNEKKLKEEISNKLKKLEGDKSNFIQMLESVKLLIETKTKVDVDLSKFDGLAQDPGLQDKVKQLKVTRLEAVLNRLSRIRVRAQHFADNVSESTTEMFLGKPILLLIGLQVFISMLLYFFSLESKVFLIGFISILLQSICLVIMRFSTESGSVKFLAKKNTNNSPIEDTEKLNNEDLFFVNAAWVTALQSEKKETEHAMKMQLNNKSYEEVKSNLVKIESEFVTTQKQMEDLNKKALTSEEYYKKRRELDILKIEKENLEYTIKDAEKLNRLEESESLLSKLNKKAEEASKNKLSMPLILLNTVFLSSQLKQSIDIMRAERQVIVINV